jgi:hypothetical protein
MTPVCIKRVVSIECGDMVAPWLIDDLERIDGRESLKLAHGDTGFCRFIAGKDWRKIKEMSFLRELQLRRVQLTVEACQSSKDAHSLFEDATPTKAANKRARNDAKARASLGALPLTISVPMPGFAYDGEIEIPDTSLTVKSSIDVKHAIMMELDAPMLQYVKHAMRKSQDSDQDKAQRNDGIRWRNDRGCWMARRRTGDGKFITKAFRPTDVMAVDAAADLAAAWVDGRDVTPLCDSDHATACDIEVASHDGSANCDALDMAESSQGSDEPSV